MITPPLNIQGRKLKIADWIVGKLPKGKRLVEPFMGAGTIAFNAGFESNLLGDLNPHIVKFYNRILEKAYGPVDVRNFLTLHGMFLEREGAAHYYLMRDIFNTYQAPLPFLFLNRTCFNGLVRFNKKGEFNTPFCRNPKRLSKVYIERVVAQVEAIQNLPSHYEIFEADFESLLTKADADDVIYCDPPYSGRGGDYLANWTVEEDMRLLNALESFSKVAVSTWVESNDEANQMLSHWLDAGYELYTRDHQYIVGSRTAYRPKVVEGLLIKTANTS